MKIAEGAKEESMEVDLKAVDEVQLKNLQAANTIIFGSPSI